MKTSFKELVTASAIVGAVVLAVALFLGIFDLALVSPVFMVFVAISLVIFVRRKYKRK